MAGRKRGRPRAEAAAPVAPPPAAAPAAARRPGPQRTPQTPFEAATAVGDSTLYKVDYIKGVRHVKGQRQYEVVWEGYGLDEATWEPMENLTGCAEQIRDYEKKRSSEDVAAKEELLRKRQKDREEKERAATELRERAAEAAADREQAVIGDSGAKEADDGDPILKKHRHKSGIVWKMFDLTKEAPTCTCKNAAGAICNEAPSATAGTTNYWSHLFNHHKQVWLELKRAEGKLNAPGHAEMQKLMEEMSKGSNTLAHAAGGEFLSAKLPNAVKDTMDRITSEWVIDADQPFNAASTPGFRRMMRASTNGRYDGCCEKTVKSHLASMADEGREEVKQMHNQLRAQGVKPAASGDMWSKNRTALFGLVTHGIRRSTCVGPDGFPRSKWEMVEKLCGAVPCSRKRHTGEHIGELSDEARKASGLYNPIEDICVRICDNGANMIKGWQEGFTVRAPCSPIMCGECKFVCLVVIAREVRGSTAFRVKLEPVS